MKLQITDLRLPLQGGVEELKRLTARKLGISADEIKEFRIVKESIDARKKPDISRVYSVIVRIPDKRSYKKGDAVRAVVEAQEEPIKLGDRKLKMRPVVVGSGPAGIFAALVLAEWGFKPIVLERGESIENRAAAVDTYWAGGKLDPESNVQFGEGGAGTFSDGKLTTRINDRRCDKVLQEYHEAGAPDEILYKAKPHIGSDVLRTVVVNMRKKLIALGGEIRFGTKVTSLLTDHGRVTGVVIGEDKGAGEQLEAEIVVLAIGHSARDTFASLVDGGVFMERKPFSIGVRIEHPQEVIDLAQYGISQDKSGLGAADYNLFYKTGGRTAYSFCMCPGGIVVASASEPDTIVTNGMSYFARDRANANSAFVVSVEPEDFGSSHVLVGVEFQRMWERKAYLAGGGIAGSSGNGGTGGVSGAAPVQRLEDFLLGRPSKAFGAVKPSYTGNVAFADLNTCLPDFVTGPMKEATAYFDRRMKGFAMADAILTGVETRTSSPVRITRGDTLEAIGIGGLYPAGEGAGYAGGIVSAAVDGMRIAEQIVRTWSPASL